MDIRKMFSSNQRLKEDKDVPQVIEIELKLL